MKAKHRKLIESGPRSPFAAPRVAAERKDISRALKVHPKQVAEANELAQKMGCGTPFRKSGMWVGTRSQKRRYMEEVNRRAVDLGQERLVNFDGGYRDVT